MPLPFDGDCQEYYSKDREDGVGIIAWLVILLSLSFATTTAVRSRPMGVRNNGRQRTLSEVRNKYFGGSVVKCDPLSRFHKKARR